MELHCGSLSQIQSVRGKEKSLVQETGFYSKPDAHWIEVSPYELTSSEGVSSELVHAEHSH